MMNMSLNINFYVCVFNGVLICEFVWWYDVYVGVFGELLLCQCLWWYVFDMSFSINLFSFNTSL